MRGSLKRLVWDYLSHWEGSYCYRNGSLGANDAGAQCVNVPNGLYELLGLSAIVGNAGEWIGFHDADREWRGPNHLDLLAVGDVALFRTDLVGPSGHVDVVLNASRRPWVGMDQNWPIGSPVERVHHYRTDLIGFIRLRSRAPIFA